MNENQKDENDQPAASRAKQPGATQFAWMPKWISVSDQLPKYSRELDSLGVEVLIWPHTGHGEATAFYGRRLGSRARFYRYGAEVHGVTHWAPIPAGPNKHPSISSADGTAARKAGASDPQDAARFVALASSILTHMNGSTMTAEQRRVQEAFETLEQSPLTLQIVRARIDAAIAKGTRE